jgi:hypothetical protein
MTHHSTAAIAVESLAFLPTRWSAGADFGVPGTTSPASACEVKRNGSTIRKTRNHSMA